MWDNRAARKTKATVTAALRRSSRLSAPRMRHLLRDISVTHKCNLRRVKLSTGLSLGVVAFSLCALQTLFGQSIQDKAWNMLETGVREKKYERRTNAVLALGLLRGNRKAVSLAEQALDDSSPEVRAAAARALGQMKSKRSVNFLRLALKDKDPSVVLAAANSLLAFKDPSAYEVFYAILTGKRKSKQGLIAEEEKTLRDRKKMAEFGIEEGLGFIPFAGMGYGAFRALTKDDVSPVRAAAAKVLANDPDPRSAQALSDTATDKSWIVRAAVLDAIARRGNPALLKSIEPALEDEKDVVRFNAAAAIIRLTTVKDSAAGGNMRKQGTRGRHRSRDGGQPQ